MYESEHESGSIAVNEADLGISIGMSMSMMEMGMTQDQEEHMNHQILGEMMEDQDSSAALMSSTHGSIAGGGEEEGQEGRERGGGEGGSNNASLLVGEDCDSVRAKITAFLASKVMTQIEFLKAIGCSTDSLCRLALFRKGSKSTLLI